MNLRSFVKALGHMVHPHKATITLFCSTFLNPLITPRKHEVGRHIELPRRTTIWEYGLLPSNSEVTPKLSRKLHCKPMGPWADLPNKYETHRGPKQNYRLRLHDKSRLWGSMSVSWRVDV